MRGEGQSDLFVPKKMTYFKKETRGEEYNTKTVLVLNFFFFKGKENSIFGFLQYL